MTRAILPGVRGAAGDNGEHGICQMPAWDDCPETGSLASRDRTWHCPAMPQSDPVRPSAPRRDNPQAGGALLAGSLIVGAVGGAILGQPTLGFLVGAGVGVVLALIVWLRERER